RSHRWRTAENSSAYLVDHLEAGMDLLDVGCGPATLTADLAARVAPGRVVGVDTAEAVLAEARRTVSSMSNVEMALGDVYHLDYGNGSFDLVHAHQVLQHLTDPVAALKEMARVCRPGGLVAVRDADYQAMTWWPQSGLGRWMEVYQAVARANGAEPDAGRRLLGWAHAAGLADVVATASVWCFATPDDRHWWGDLWAERVVASRLAEQAVEKSIITSGELIEMAEAWRRWAAHPDGWFSVVHGEILARVG
ncbi:MAG: methyltransferase domain-containing protein, partial [Acidimicrobiia bacterium]